MASPPVGGGDELGALTDEHEQIERQIAKLEEDSAKDVQRQLEQQRLAAEECKVEQVCLSDFGSASLKVPCVMVRYGTLACKGD